MRRWWNDERCAALVELYLEGKTYREIATELRSTPSSVGQQISKLRAAGVKLPWRGGGVDVYALNERVKNMSIDQRKKD